MKIGYARISTDDQSLGLQRDALNAAGCKKVFEDTESGAKADRPGLAQALDHLREGDTLVIWRLDRLGRSLDELIRIVNNFKDQGIGLESLTEKIDTTSAAGELIFHIFGAFAQFERNLIIERTKAGLLAAKARGRRGGRPTISKSKQEAIKELSRSDMPVSRICKTLGIGYGTYYRYLDR